MPKIIIKNMDHRTIVTSAVNQPVLETLQKEYIDWMHACGGKGRCTTCKMVVSSGQEYLASPTAHEQRFIKLGLLASNERLSCQAILKKGELEITVPANSKLPHVEYSY